MYLIYIFSSNQTKGISQGYYTFLGFAISQRQVTHVSSAFDDPCVSERGNRCKAATVSMW